MGGVTFFVRPGSGAAAAWLPWPMYGHKGGSRDFRPPPLRKGRRADYSSMKSMFTWRWNASCSEICVSVEATPWIRRMPSKIVRMRCSLSTQ